MARRHGRNGAVYLAATSGAAASPLTFQAAWSVSITTGKRDVTGYADSQIVYAADTPDISGTFSGFMDDQSSQAYIAAADGLPRAFCLYPDAVNSPSVFFAGTVIADFSGGGASGGPVTVSGTWSAEAAVQRYPLGGGPPATAPRFPSVPGRAVPGQFTPGEPGDPVITGLAGLLDETAAAEITDEGGGIILNEDGS